MKPRPTIVFGGAYGIESQGDDAALLALVTELRGSMGGFDGIVISRHPEGDHYAPYGARSIAGLEYSDRESSLGKWFRGFNVEDDRGGLQRLREAIRQSDLLVLGAGNWLNDGTIDLFRGPVPHFAVLVLMARMVGTPVMGFGLSVGPLVTRYGRDLCRLSVGLVDAMTVRDAQSRTLLEELGSGGAVEQLPDPVLGLEPQPEQRASSFAAWRQAHTGDRPVFPISVRSVGDEQARERYLVCMAELSDRLVERYGGTVLFVPQCGYSRGEPREDDREVARRVVRRMKRPDGARMVEGSLDVRDAMSLYSGGAVAVCTRLHGNVFAAIQSVPSVAVSYHAKVAAFHHWLGQEDLVVPLEDICPDQIMERVDLAMSELQGRREAIDRRVEQGRHQVRRYGTIARRLMKTDGPR